MSALTNRAPAVLIALAAAILFPVAHAASPTDPVNVSYPEWDRDGARAAL